MNEFDSPNYCEYTWDVKSEGKRKILKYVLIACYVAFVAAFFLVCYSTRIIPLFAVCPIFTWMLVFFTWKYVSYDCYFEFGAGMLELGTIKVKKSGRVKNLKVKIHLKEAEYASLYTEKLPEGAPAGTLPAVTPECLEKLKVAKKVYDFSETMYSDKRIFIFFRNEGVPTAVIFEGTAKIAKMVASFCESGASLKGEMLHG